MQAFLKSCKPLLLLNSSPTIYNGCPLSHGSWSPASRSLESPSFSADSPPWRVSHVPSCSKDGSFISNLSTQLPEKAEGGRVLESYEFGLRDKPSPLSGGNDEGEKPEPDDALAPFLKFLKPRDGVGEGKREEDSIGVEEEKGDVGGEDDGKKKVNVEYYAPKPGDFVVGVVVSGNENKLDINVGADMLGTMLTKEVLPLYQKEMDHLECDLGAGSQEFMVEGRMGIIKNEVAFSAGPGPGKPVIETGTVLFAEVLGRTLSGRPLLSSRRLFRRVAWQRVRQIKEVNEPIQVQITEWNTGGLLARIEGLRAFLPKVELMAKVANFKELKENVGRRIYVLINRIDEANNDLILSEKEAWEMMNLQEGSLLEGTVRRIFPYGAQVGIGKTNRSGLLHITNISRTRVPSTAEVLKVNEKVKVLVVKSMFPDKISLSTADLESEPGLFLSNKQKVFADAEEMAKKYRQKLHSATTSSEAEAPPNYVPSFHDDAATYANWRWFKFERDNEALEVGRKPLLVSGPN